MQVIKETLNNHHLNEMIKIKIFLRSNSIKVLDLENNNIVIKKMREICRIARQFQ
jgi:hypothetical protein